MDNPLFLSTNATWLEALDSSSGRLYYINRETHATAWEPPEHFLERGELAAKCCELFEALRKVDADHDDEDRFMKKVRARFPPPPGAPPAGAAKKPPALQKTAQSAPVNPKAWKRGASIVLDEPPPAPAWALAKAKSAQDYRCAGTVACVLRRGEGWWLTKRVRAQCSSC
eukprot:3941256-Prymnesium_polylepis.1